MSNPFEGPNAKHAEPPTAGDRGGKHDAYWRQCLRVVYLILGIWAFISLGCGILLRDILDASMPKIGHAPFGFWMAQQGAIIGFLILLFVYMVLMNVIDRRHGFDRDGS